MWTLVLFACTAVDPSDTADPADTADTADTDVPADPVPVVYPADRVHSPLTPFVAARLAEIAAAGPAQSADVFMKVGASSTVSRNALYCFAGDNVDLGEQTALQPTLAFYLGGTAGDTTPFDRDTLAAESGKTASWAVSGDPSPLVAELDAISPRLAVIHYGTNDMGMAGTYEAALDLFVGHMTTLLDTVQARGVVPILTGISRRGDSVAADRWVDTFNAALRGLAQDRQTPFVDLELATRDLAGYGLSGDGLHLEPYLGGPCQLTADGLEHGYNVRNLIVLQALDRVHRALDLAEPAPDAGLEQQGDGSPADPYVIALPFAHVADTAASPWSDLDAYDGCAASQDESGPEWRYTLTLAATTPIRLAVADQGDADVDLHLLDATGTTAGCLARGHRVIAGTLQAGTYEVVVDTFVDDGTPLPGAYLLTAVACLPDDPGCATAL